MIRKYEETISEELRDARVIDGHNHVWDKLNYFLVFSGSGPEQVVEKNFVDIPTFIKDSYFKHDLMLSGMKANHQDLLEKDPEKNWKLFSPFIKKAENTTYSKIFRIALKDLYGIDRLTEENWREASRVMKEKSSEKGWMEYVLKDKCHLDFGILDHVWDVVDFKVDGRFFKPVLRIDPFVQGWDPNFKDFFGNQPWKTARVWDMPMNDFDDYLALVDEAVKRCLAADGATFKVALAYERTLEVSEPSKEEAEKAFGKSGREVSAGEIKAFEDYVINHLVDRAAEKGVPVQIHTGMLGGISAAFHHSNPTQLFDLILRKPEAKFVVLHGGYPHAGEAGAMAKVFPNVYLDITWLAIISQSALEHGLEEWLDAVPGNKILWGTDACNTEEVYSITQIAKESLSRVLAKKVDRGDFSTESAVTLGKGILRDNTLALLEVQ